MKIRGGSFDLRGPLDAGSVSVEIEWLDVGKHKSDHRPKKIIDEGGVAGLCQAQFSRRSSDHERGSGRFVLGRDGCVKSACCRSTSRRAA